MGKLHDKLQSECFLWFYNNHPNLRYLMHSNLNNLTSQIPKEKAIRIMGMLKGMGLVKGVLDLEFYYKGVLHVFDIKVGRDSLKNEQKDFIKAIENQGGRGYVIRSIEDFKTVINKILDAEDRRD